MRQPNIKNEQERLIDELSDLWKDQEERALIAKTVQTLNARYDLERKMADEPEVAQIIVQMAGRLANSYGRLADMQGKRILDIACGSNTSKLPASLYVNTPFGEMRLGRASKGYTALFEPWFCRMLLEWEAVPVGIDFGDLEKEAFLHYLVDLGKTGALDFLPAASFDGIQDSRLFGSPEFTAEFPNPADRLKVAREIRRQEQRLLKADGMLIHSDAAAMLG